MTHNGDPGYSGEVGGAEGIFHAAYESLVARPAESGAQIEVENQDGAGMLQTSILVGTPDLRYRVRMLIQNLSGDEGQRSAREITILAQSSASAPGDRPQGILSATYRVQTDPLGDAGVWVETSRRNRPLSTEELAFMRDMGFERQVEQTDQNFPERPAFLAGRFFAEPEEVALLSTLPERVMTYQG